jgi:hypothetical protein
MEKIEKLPKIAHSTIRNSSRCWPLRLHAI